MLCIAWRERISSKAIFAADATVPAVDNYLGSRVRGNPFGNLNRFVLSRGHFRRPFISCPFNAQPALCLATCWFLPTFFSLKPTLSTR
jgi:hypothetical protein